MASLQQLVIQNGIGNSDTIPVGPGAFINQGNTPGAMQQSVMQQPSVSVAQTLNTTNMTTYQISDYEGKFVAAQTGGYTYFVQNGQLRLMNPLPANYNWSQFPVSLVDASVASWPMGNPWDWSVGAPGASAATTSSPVATGTATPSQAPLILGITFGLAGGIYYLVKRKDMHIAKGILITVGAAATGVIIGLLYNQTQQNQ